VKGKISIHIHTVTGKSVATMVMESGNDFVIPRIIYLSYNMIDRIFTTQARCFADGRGASVNKTSAY